MVALGSPKAQVPVRAGVLLPACCLASNPVDGSDASRVTTARGYTPMPSKRTTVHEGDTYPVISKNFPAGVIMESLPPRLILPVEANNRSPAR